MSKGASRAHLAIARGDDLDPRPSRARRLSAIVLASLFLLAFPLWVAQGSSGDEPQAMSPSNSGPGSGGHHDDDDNSGPGSGDDDDDTSVTTTATTTGRETKGKTDGGKSTAGKSTRGETDPGDQTGKTERV